MDDTEIYNQYSFAKKQKALAYKNLMIVSVVVVTCIILIFAWGFLKSFDFLGTTRESVTKPIAETEVSVDKNAQALKESITNYENAGIPFTDPANRYSIQFLNPFPNGDVAIIFYVKIFPLVEKLSQ